jgi:hypothetical protein
VERSAVQRSLLGNVFRGSAARDSWRFVDGSGAFIAAYRGRDELAFEPRRCFVFPSVSGPSVHETPSDHVLHYVKLLFHPGPSCGPRGEQGYTPVGIAESSDMTKNQRAILVDVLRRLRRDGTLPFLQPPIKLVNLPSLLMPGGQYSLSPNGIPYWAAACAPIEAWPSTFSWMPSSWDCVAEL